MSETWIKKWTDEKAKYERLGLPLSKLRDRIIKHKASLFLGREFGESGEDFKNRRGLVEYYDWTPDF